MKKLLNISLKLTCGAEKFGLCDTLNINLNLDLEVQSSNDELCRPEISSHIVDYATFSPKKLNGLESFVDKNHKDIWDDLTDDQKEDIHSWITKRLKEEEIKDLVEEEFVNKCISEAERYYERISER
jgi:hypothetical protein